MIGNQTDARLAVAGDLFLIGQGSTRDCFLSEDVVYKVDQLGGVNPLELKNLERISKLTLPPHIRIPAFAPFYVNRHMVVAMEYICGIAMKTCWHRECSDQFCMPMALADEITNLTGVTDLCYGNVIAADDGAYWLVDCAE